MSWKVDYHAFSEAKHLPHGLTNTQGFLYFISLKVVFGTSDC